MNVSYADAFSASDGRLASAKRASIRSAHFANVAAYALSKAST